jgi:hypothetical protein
VAIRLILTVSILVLQSCALSPGRNLLPPGQFEPSVATTLFLSPKDGGFPVLPSMSVGARYGVTDRITIGGDWIIPPIIFDAAVLSLNPHFVFQPLRAQGPFPALNTYLELPLLLSLREKEIRAYPLLGMVARKEWKKLALYPLVEFSFTDNLELHTNARLGMEFKLRTSLKLNLEAGVDNIGHPNPFGNITFGYPALHVGLSKEVGGAKKQ